MSNGWKETEIPRRKNICSCYMGWYVIEWKNKDAGCGREYEDTMYMGT